MSTLSDWASRHNISPAAMVDLSRTLCVASEPDPSLKTAETEQGVQQRERLTASLKGGRLWRNNSGAYCDDRGVWVRYGLCNDSKAINAHCKSSDLIGIMPVEITEQMVGDVIGQFTAREVKKPGWKYRGTPREVAQAHFITIVNQLGGDGRFVS